MIRGQSVRVSSKGGKEGFRLCWTGEYADTTQQQPHPPCPWDKVSVSTHFPLALSASEAWWRGHLGRSGKSSGMRWGDSPTVQDVCVLLTMSMFIPRPPSGQKLNWMVYSPTQSWQFNPDLCCRSSFSDEKTVCKERAFGLHSEGSWGSAELPQRSNRTGPQRPPTDMPPLSPLWPRQPLSAPYPRY